MSNNNICNNRPFYLAALLALSACSTEAGNNLRPTVGNTHESRNQRIPPFARLPYEPFSRQNVVAIALREWRLFGGKIDDADAHSRPEPSNPYVKAERQPGLWQRVGEYWWVGIPESRPEAAYTGKHDANGRVFDFTRDGLYAWSAAFISYVMQIAAAGDRFPYSQTHSVYINRAAQGNFRGLIAHNPASYSPKNGDLVCFGRGEKSSKLTFANLPTPYQFPSHCGIVVGTKREAPPFGRHIEVIGGNVDDAVALTRVPTDQAGRISSSSGESYDDRYNWLTVLEVKYQTEYDPDP